MRTASTIEAQSVNSATPSAKKRKMNPRSLANLVAPFKPGQSGNPGGIPKNDVSAEIARAIFTQNPELIYKAFTKALDKGNAYAFQVLADRGYGKLKETKEVTHKYEDVPDTDLQRRIDELMRDLGLAQQVDAVANAPGIKAGAGSETEQAQVDNVLP